MLITVFIVVWKKHTLHSIKSLDIPNLPTSGESTRSAVRTAGVWLWITKELSETYSSRPRSERGNRTVISPKFVNNFKLDKNS